jgi:hypothetical protein
MEKFVAISLASTLVAAVTGAALAFHGASGWVLFLEPMRAFYGVWLGAFLYFEIRFALARRADPKTAGWWSGFQELTFCNLIPSVYSTVRQIAAIPGVNAFSYCKASVDFFSATPVSLTKPNSASVIEPA